jgi:hypothetical protein
VLAEAAFRDLGQSLEFLGLNRPSAKTTARTEWRALPR